MRFNNAMNM